MLFIDVVGACLSVCNFNDIYVCFHDAVDHTQHDDSPASLARRVFELMNV